MTDEIELSPAVQKIKSRRIAMGLSQEQLAQKLGCATSRIGKWEIGTGSPDAGQIWALAEALNVTTEWICSPDADPENPEQIDQIPRELEQILDLVQALGWEESRRRLIGLGPGIPRSGNHSPRPRGLIRIRLLPDHPDKHQ